MLISAATEKLGIYVQFFNFALETTGKPNGQIEYEVVNSATAGKVIDYIEELAERRRNFHACDDREAATVEGVRARPEYDPHQDNGSKSWRNAGPTSVDIHTL